ncbi:MAG: hypothetical protein ACFFG0_41670 [Candidatus Thorarchaeota archaeon]
MLVIKCPRCDSYDTDFDYDKYDFEDNLFCEECGLNFNRSDAFISSVVGEIYRD